MANLYASAADPSDRRGLAVVLAGAPTSEQPEPIGAADNLVITVALEYYPLEGFRNVRLVGLHRHPLTVTATTLPGAVTGCNPVR